MLGGSGGAESDESEADAAAGGDETAGPEGKSPGGVRALPGAFSLTGGAGWRTMGARLARGQWRAGGEFLHYFPREKGPSIRRGHHDDLAEMVAQKRRETSAVMRLAQTLAAPLEGARPGRRLLAAGVVSEGAPVRAGAEMPVTSTFPDPLKATAPPGRYQYGCLRRQR